ncbi:hypothetical protein AN189_05070 [Loktanella sp. 3ANDIMAR09]|uniref:TfoX/Sxy family protein n=1 Tax=Loktanella sp. 3ANDIMAR09 TaxID=1225657 RepID=UPI0006F94B77|nr:TfoX/Sxy family protein [Loktanella sp. 3ANDIMAR09]KQI69742.1 hypothetical protein AN189_05070 [Loktanella sp. 3ANDIMAR09]
MAFDDGLAHLWREELIDHPGIAERRMFGGLCFLSFGHMLCGVIGDAGMARVGKGSTTAALDLPGVTPLVFGARTMGGLVTIDPDAMAEDDIRNTLLRMALDFTGSLPPK